MMHHPAAVRTCCVAQCGNPSHGHFCDACWRLLPWDMKGAIGRAKKTGRSTLTAVKHAKEFIERQKGVTEKGPACSTN